MANQNKKITIEQLTEVEKRAVNRLLNEAYSLYSSTGNQIDFEALLNMLTDTLHETFLAHRGKQTQGS